MGAGFEGKPASRNGRDVAIGKNYLSRITIQLFHSSGEPPYESFQLLRHVGFLKNHRTTRSNLSNIVMSKVWTKIRILLSN